MSFLFQTVITMALAANPCKGKERLYYFNMPIMVGTSIFNDQVEICVDKGKYFGQLTVPKRFTALIEDVKKEGNDLSFSITADEGKGKFQVFYKGELKEKDKYFMGMARLKGNQILGPFIGISSVKKQTFKIVQ